MSNAKNKHIETVYIWKPDPVEKSFNNNDLLRIETSHLSPMSVDS